jgi:hypothetical protein
MSGFKYSISLFILAFLFFLSGFLIGRGTNRPEPTHNLTLYNSEGDTILDLDTEVSSVKIWIEENGEPDVWTSNEDGGWTRK